MAILVDILQYGTGSHTTSSEAANALATDILTDGVVGTCGNSGGIAPMTGGFAVNAQGTPDTTVAVTAGVAYVTGTPTSQGSQRLRVKMTANEDVTISANASGSTRYDWIYIKLDPTNMADPNTAADNVATLVTSRSTSSAVDNGTPPAYGLVIAKVVVANGFSSITNGNITDARNQINTSTNLAGSVVSNGWTALGYAPTTIAANGNRSYTLTYSGIDLTGTLSPGMKLRMTRSIAAPTQCTSLNGTTQYYSKTSPAGMTFTDDFVVSAWVKLSNYGGTYTIASRFNGSSGWDFGVTSTGTVYARAFNGGAGNYRRVDSYQCLPMNKWVHISVEMDMSAFTATDTTVYVTIDGTNVPVLLTGGGTNPTALVQAGNMEVGSSNGGQNPFAGKIAQVAVYSAKVSQATIRASMHQTLTGAEANLAAAYTFNNSINDLSTNANNLTASGSAVATAGDSPFAQGLGSTEYGVIATSSFSTDTTMVVQVPEGSAIPTSGGVGSVSYSTQNTPYGWPNNPTKWIIEALYAAAIFQSISGNTWYQLPGVQLSLTPGAWQLGYKIRRLRAAITATGTGYLTAESTLSTTSASGGSSDEQGKWAAGNGVDFGNGGTAPVTINTPVQMDAPVNISSTTTYYANYLVNPSSHPILVGHCGSPERISIYAQYRA